MHAAVENSPDIQIVIQDVIAEGDKTAIQFTVNGKTFDREARCHASDVHISFFRGANCRRMAARRQLHAPVEA